MPTGIECFNSSGELTFSSESQTLRYIGQATLVGTTPSTSTQAGFATYTINWAGGYIAVGTLIPTSAATAVAITDISYSLNPPWVGNTTWTITVKRANGSLNAQGFPDPGAPAVHVWGYVSLVPNNYGLVVYNQSGNPVADLSFQPLSFAARAEFAAGSLNSTVTFLGGFQTVGNNFYPMLMTSSLGFSNSNSGNGGFGTYTMTSRIARHYRIDGSIFRIFTNDSQQTGWEDANVPYSYSESLPAQTLWFSDGFKFVSF